VEEEVERERIRRSEEEEGRWEGAKASKGGVGEDSREGN